jgi:hypothetical protein
MVGELKVRGRNPETPIPGATPVLLSVQPFQHRPGTKRNKSEIRHRLQIPPEIPITPRGKTLLEDTQPPGAGRHPGNQPFSVEHTLPTDAARGSGSGLSGEARPRGGHLPLPPEHNSGQALGGIQSADHEGYLRDRGERLRRRTGAQWPGSHRRTPRRLGRIGTSSTGWEYGRPKTARHQVWNRLVHR